jgi:acyl-CoA thioesterase FadM
MSGFTSRWVVRSEQPVGSDDLDADGVISAGAVQRWATAASRDYLDRCAALQAMIGARRLDVRIQVAAVADAARLGRVESVIVSAGATELRSTDFTIAVRVRATSDDAVGVECRVAVADPATGDATPLSDDVRDELIALEHGAAQFN